PRGLCRGNRCDEDGEYADQPHRRLQRTAAAVSRISVPGAGTAAKPSMSGVPDAVAALLTRTYWIQFKPRAPISTPAPPPEPSYAVTISANVCPTGSKAGFTGLRKLLNVPPGLGAYGSVRSE